LKKAFDNWSSLTSSSAILPWGRQAYIKGSTLAVWEVISVAESYQLDVKQTARHLNWPGVRVQAALNYAEAFPEEIRLAIEENDAADFDALKRLLPSLESFSVSIGRHRSK
jgi:hypothetical protein